MKTLRIHRLVATAFIPNQNVDINKFVHHIDGNPTNNNVSNLMWCTTAYNNSEPIAISRRTHDGNAIIEEIKAINPNVNYISGYKNTGVKCLWKCNICGNEWKSTPSHLKSGSGCPQCSKEKQAVVIRNPVFQYKNGILIEVFNSVTTASKKTGTGRRNISNCLTGRTKSAGGYQWEYVEDTVKRKVR